MNKFYYLNSNFDLELGGYDQSRYMNFCLEMSSFFLTCGTAADAVKLEITVDDLYLEYLKSSGIEHPRIISDDETLSGYTPVLWGASPSAVSLINKLKIEYSFPESACIKKSNSRDFSAEIAMSLGNPVHTKIFTDEAGLRSYIETADFFPLIVKSAHGSSGSGFAVFRDNHIDRKNSNKLTFMFKTESPSAVAERWVERVYDFSYGFTLQRDGAVNGFTLRKTVSTTKGVFSAVEITPDTAHDLKDYMAEIEETAAAAADRLRTIGYYGPVNIDGFLFKDDGGHIKINPICEINARLSMAYILLCLNEKFSPGYSSIHIIASKSFHEESDYNSLAETLGADNFTKGRGILFASPLSYYRENQKVKPTKYLIYTAGDSLREHNHYCERLQKLKSHKR